MVRPGSQVGQHPHWRLGGAAGVVTDANNTRDPLKYTLNITGKTRAVDVDPEMPLLWVLGDRLNEIGTKFGFGTRCSRRQVAGRESCRSSKQASRYEQISFEDERP